MNDIKCDICGGECCVSGRYTLRRGVLKYFSVFRTGERDICCNCTHILGSLSDDIVVVYKFSSEDLNYALVDYLGKHNDYAKVCEQFCLINDSGTLNKIELSIALRTIIYQELGFDIYIPNNLAQEIIRKAWFKAMGRSYR